MKRLLYAAAVLLLAVSTGILGGCSMKLRFDTYDDAGKYLTCSFDYDAADIDELEIDWVAGEITLVQSDDATLSVSENGGSLPETKRMHWYLDGRTLRIKYCASGFVGEIDSAEKHLTVELPAGIALDVENVSARITADALELSEFELDNVSGETALAALKADRVELDTISGSIDIDSIAAGDIDAESVSGALLLANISAPTLKLVSVSGAVELSLLDCGTASLTGTSSEMRIELLGGLGATLEFNGVSGRLRTDADYSVTDDRRIFGDGGCKLSVSTVSGDLNLILAG